MWMSRMLPRHHGGSTRWTRSLPIIGVAAAANRRFPRFSAVADVVEEQINTGTRFARREGRRRGRGHERPSSEHLHRSRRSGRSGRSHRRSAGGSWTGGRNSSTNRPSLDRGPGTPPPSGRDGIGLRPPGRRQRPPRQRLSLAPRARARRAVCDTLPRVFWIASYRGLHAIRRGSSRFDPLVLRDPGDVRMFEPREVPPVNREGPR
jgi:hypothetical protein